MIIKNYINGLCDVCNRYTLIHKYDNKCVDCINGGY